MKSILQKFLTHSITALAKVFSIAKAASTQRFSDKNSRKHLIRASVILGGCLIEMFLNKIGMDFPLSLFYAALISIPIYFLFIHEL